MTFQAVTRQPASRRRAGFTLIELMIVILIIAILIALAFPAINAVLRSARVATAKSEMNAIGTAIASFESEFGKIPPSYITFNTADPKWPASKAILRSMFPEISFSTTATPNIQTDLTKAGLWGETLEGSEAIVFFLGGVRRDVNDNDTVDENGNGEVDDGDELELVGFSKNPARPFAQPSAGQSNRIGPFFEFDARRLVDVNNNNLLEYLDALPDQTKPLAYVSTALTGSYDASDANLPPYDIPNDNPDAGAVNWTPYQKSKGSFYNPTSYQLISPGFLGDYGKGGIFNEDTPAVAADADNLTNFYSSELGG